MSLKPDREAIVRVGKYSDDSGYAAEAKVFGDGDDTFVKIDVTLHLSVQEWRDLRAGIEDAINMVAKGNAP